MRPYCYSISSQILSVQFLIISYWHFDMVREQERDKHTSLGIPLILTLEISEILPQNLMYWEAICKSIQMTVSQCNSFDVRSTKGTLWESSRKRMICSLAVKRKENICHSGGPWKATRDNWRKILNWFLEKAFRKQERGCQSGY